MRGDAYIPLEVSSSSADGSGRVTPVGLEQFDLQGPGVSMIGVDTGWYEPEYDPRTSRSWRWSSEKAAFWVRPVGRDVRLSLSGESPLKYFDTAPVVTITIADREIDRFSPSADFAHEVVLPAEALAGANGLVILNSDKWFVPAERNQSLDKRHLALRIYSYRVR